MWTARITLHVNMTPYDFPRDLLFTSPLTSIGPKRSIVTLHHAGAGFSLSVGSCAIAWLSFSLFLFIFLHSTHLCLMDLTIVSKRVIQNFNLTLLVVAEMLV